MVLDILGQVFWFGILATPIISFLLVRNTPIDLGWKILLGVFATLAFAGMFYCIAIGILFRNGLGPG
jgi:hypothetical protein